MRGSASWSVVNLPQKHLVPTFDSWQRDKLKGCKTFQQWPKKPLQSLPKRYSMRMYSSCFIHYLVFKMTKFGCWHLWFSHNVWLPLQGVSYHLSLNSKLVKGRNSGAWRMPHWCKALGGSGQYLKDAMGSRSYIIIYLSDTIWLYNYICSKAYPSQSEILMICFSEFNWNTNLACQISSEHALHVEHSLHVQTLEYSKP